MEIKKAVIPIAGLGTRFLPLSKVLPKELWPLVDTPVIQFIVEEAVKSGIKEIIFVVKPGKKMVLDYFKKKLKSKKILKAKYKDHFLNQLENLENLSKKVSFSTVIQKKPLGDGDALLKAEKLIGGEPCAALWADDVVESKTPCLLQLIKTFEKYKKPIIALCRIPKESIPFYGIVEVEKITKRLFKIKRIIEKPSITQAAAKGEEENLFSSPSQAAAKGEEENLFSSPGQAPSNLAIVGKSIITNEVFNFLKKAKFGERGEVGLTETFIEMINNGEKLYGYEFEGKWLECGNKSAYLKSNFYLSLKHPQFGKELRKFLRSRTW